MKKNRDRSEFKKIDKPWQPQLQYQEAPLQSRHSKQEASLQPEQPASIVIMV